MLFCTLGPAHTPLSAPLMPSAVQLSCSPPTAVSAQGWYFSFQPTNCNARCLRQHDSVQGVRGEDILRELQVNLAGRG